jgi:hypothetical protein
LTCLFLIEPKGLPVNSPAKLYRYVGPDDIRIRARQQPAGLAINSAHDLQTWLQQTDQKPNAEGRFAVTFVVDAGGCLRIADRGSEHVACAAGGPVLSAGEMFLTPSDHGLSVEEISNQSTGFCPEPESWPAIATALSKLGIPHPGRFTREIVFRRCPACRERNIVKDGWFVCGVCGGDLPAQWNF